MYESFCANFNGKVIVVLTDVQQRSRPKNEINAGFFFLTITQPKRNNKLKIKKTGKTNPKKAAGQKSEGLTFAESEEATIANASKKLSMIAAFFNIKSGGW